MKNFSRNDSSSRTGNFPRRGQENKGFSRGREQKSNVEMHSATCSECKGSCEVPFKPISGKPVLCNACFSTKSGAPAKRNDRRDFGGRDSGRDFGRKDFGEKQSFRAVCSECGDSCELPFKPNSGKPVFCSYCFASHDDGGISKRGRENFSQDNYSNNKQIEKLGEKLDQIITLLNKLCLPEVKKEVKTEKKVAIKEVEVEEVVAKKPAKKKEVKKTTAVKAKKVSASKKK